MSTIPLKMASDQTQRYGPEIKLKPGVSFLEGCRSRIPALVSGVRQADAEHLPRQFKVSVLGLAETYTRDLKKTMYLLSRLLRSCSPSAAGNVSISFSSRRGTARQHEFAVRSAGRERIPHRAPTPHRIVALVSAFGAGMGVFVAWRAIGFYHSRLPDHSYPYEADLSHQPACFVFQRGPGGP